MLGIGSSGNISPDVTSPMLYDDLSSLASYSELDIHFDFSKLGETYVHDEAVGSVANLGAAGSDYEINSAEGTPTYKTNVVNGRSAVFFDGTDDILDMKADYVTSGKHMTLFIVFQKDDVSNDHILASADNTETDFIRTAASGGSIVFKGENQTAVTITTNNTNDSSVDYTLRAEVPTIYVVRRNAAGEIFIYADRGGFIAQKTNTAAKAAATFKLGAIGGTTSGTKADIGGYICEVGLYDADIAEAAIETLMVHLSDKWGVE